MKFFIIALLLFFQTVTFGMTQGSAEYGGNIGLGYSSSRGTVIQFSPKYQYFIIDKLSVGGTIDFHKEKAITESGFGPSMTYYFLDEGSYIPFFRQALLNYSFSGDIVRGENGWYGTSALGLYYFTTTNFAIGFSAMSFYSLEGKSFSKETTHMLISFNFFP